MRLNIAAFESAPLAGAPYPHAIVPGFLDAESLDEAARDFPRLDFPGSFPPDALDYGPGFAALLAAMEGATLRRAVAAKFGLELEGRPVMATVRGMARARDGQIHRDADFKLVTLLLYLNAGWEGEGGRLRVLRSAGDIEDYAAEIPPAGGTLFAFRCTAEAWHGHKPFDGPRRSLQINYVTDAAAMRRELARHRFSARMKRLGRMVGIGGGKAA